MGIMGNTILLGDSTMIYLVFWLSGSVVMLCGYFLGFAKGYNAGVMWAKAQLERGLELCDNDDVV